MYHYPGFRVGRDAKKLSKELKHNLTRFTAWEAVCRVRCSKGFRVSSFNGHFFIRSMDLLALPAANADQAYAVQIAHDEVLPTTNTSYLQCALLYTNAEGERRIRVHTMMVPVVSDVAQMYRATDGGAMSAFLTRLACESALSRRLQDARENMQVKLSNALKEFRLLNTSASRAFNRLIYPEKMKLMPLFALCAGKSLALRGASRDVLVDERVRAIFEIMGAPTEAILRRLYPAMYALHSMPGKSGTVDDSGRVVMPPRTALAGERVDARGCYLVDDGNRCLLWLGKMCDPAFVLGVFGKGLSHFHAPPTRLPILVPEGTVIPSALTCPAKGRLYLCPYSSCEGRITSARTRTRIDYYLTLLFLQPGPSGPPGPDVDFDLPETDGELNSRVRCVLDEVNARAANGCHSTITVIAQGHPSEALLFPHLVEDRGAGGAGAMSYADFLIQLHRQVAQTGGHTR